MYIASPDDLYDSLFSAGRFVCMTLFVGLWFLYRLSFFSATFVWHAPVCRNDFSCVFYVAGPVLPVLNTPMA